MIVIEEQLLLDLHYLGVKVEVGVGPGSVEVLAHQVTPAAQGLHSVVLSYFDFLSILGIRGDQLEKLMIHQTFRSPWIAIWRTDLFLIYHLYRTIRTSYNQLFAFL